MTSYKIHILVGEYSKRSQFFGIIEESKHHPSQSLDLKSCSSIAMSRSRDIGNRMKHPVLS